MKLKLPVKHPESRSYLIPWILEKFPQNYENLTYVEPFLGTGCVLLNKKPSVEEVCNDPDLNLIKIWQALRDEPKLFLSKIKKIKHSEIVFKKYLNKQQNGDYIEDAIKEFVLLKMSRGGLKKNYLKESGADVYKNINEISERIKNVHLVNKNPIDIIKSFNNDNSFLYCNNPGLNDNNSNAHIEVAESLKSFRGKVIVLGENVSIYKRIYKEWNKKSIPDHPKECIWLNF